MTMTAEEAAATAALFKALADPRRVRIVNLLATSPDPVCVCDLVDVLGLAQPTVSHHLKKLVTAGLLVPETALLASLGCGNPTAVADRAERGSYVGCIAGALSRTEYQHGLAETGFEQVQVTFTHQVADGLHSAIIKATKLATVAAPVRRTELPLADQPTSGCC